MGSEPGRRSGRATTCAAGRASSRWPSPLQLGWFDAFVFATGVGIACAGALARLWGQADFNQESIGRVGCFNRRRALASVLPNALACHVEPRADFFKVIDSNANPSACAAFLL